MITRADERRRVLVSVNDLGLGGTQLNAVDFALSVRRYGFDSVLVGSRQPYRADTSLVDVAAERGIPLHVLQAPRSALAEARQLTSLSRHIRADLVHAYSAWNVRPAFWGPHLVRRLPLVVTAYEMALPADLYTSPFLIVGTQNLIEQLEGRPGASYMISPPVDTDRDRPGGPDEFWPQYECQSGGLRVLMVTRLSIEMKAAGVDATMHAVERLASYGATLVIVGSGDAEAVLRRRGEDINRRLGGRHVVFTGQSRDPAPAYSGADVVVGMGGSAARALAFGKPLVVVGDHAWSCVFSGTTAKALYRNSFWSDVIAERPVEVLTEQLESLLLHPAARAELGAFGRMFALQNFGLQNMTAQLADVYRNALANPVQPLRWVKDVARNDARRAPGWLERRVAFLSGIRPR